MEAVLRGVAVAPGIRIGAAVVRVGPSAQFSRAEHAGAQSPRSRTGPQHSPAAEQARLDTAIGEARKQLDSLAGRLASRGRQQEQKIFKAHLLLLDDPLLLDPIRDATARGLTAAEAVDQVVRNLVERFQALPDPYLRERAADVEDVGRRLAANLEGDAGRPDAAARCGILLAKSLTPSEVGLLDPDRVPGIVTEEGGRAGHAAILARALNIAAVSGIKDLLALAREGDGVIVDGGRGEIILRPDDGTIAEYRRRAVAEDALRERLAAGKHLPAITLDGFRVEVAANISGPAEMEEALGNGAEGVGLFRTEFLYLGRERPPAEDEQAAVYSRVLSAAAPRRVTIRTMDLGGDKQAGSAKAEPNPALGLRGIRLSLAHEELFCAQLRALLRAAPHGKLSVMLPMITEMEEVRRAKGILARLSGELGMPAPPLGIMIETPAAALLAEELAQEVAFFSIGTNDLAQYTLAVDRENQQVAALYQPLHPAVLRLIRHVVEAASRRNVPVAVCGEMAGDPLAAPLLVGMGIAELSMSPASVPAIKALMRQLRRSELVVLADDVLKLSSAAAVVERMRVYLAERTSEECAPKPW